MSYRDASDDDCTAALMQAAHGFSAPQVAGAAATLLAQSCVQRATTLRAALDLFEAHVAEARHELEINFSHGRRRELS